MPKYPGFLQFLSIILLAGCAASNRGISVDEGAPVSLSGVRTFEVVARNMPAFLGPIVASNFSVAMAEQGFQPVGRNGEGIVTLRFEQDTLGDEQDRDDFDERIDQEGDTRFVARVVADMLVKSTGEVIRLGSIQRLHIVRPGDYMHTGNASVALLASFRTMLADIRYTGGQENGEIWSGSDVRKNQ